MVKFYSSRGQTVLNLNFVFLSDRIKVKSAYNVKLLLDFLIVIAKITGIICCNGKDPDYSYVSWARKNKI